MKSKSEINAIAARCFPRPKPNPGQMEAIVDAVHAILNGKKHVIISAPTGTGKSIIATTIHRVLKQIKTRWRTTLITSTKGLQDQYTTEDNSIMDLRGKTNYSCPMGVGPYNSGGCRSKIAAGKCSKSTQCPYVRRRTAWCNLAEIRITNSSFQISAPPKICMEEENIANLIVIDECHEIDDLIIEHTSIKMNVEDLQHIRRYGGEKLLVALMRYIELFKSISIGSTFAITDQIYNGMESINEMVDDLTNQLEEYLEATDRNDLELIGDLIENLGQFKDTTEIFNACDQRKGTWILHEYGPGRMEIKPVYAWQVAGHSIFRKAPCFVHMSATICGYDQYKQNLGITNDESIVIEVPNSIPVQNRVVKVIPTQKVSGNYDIEKLVKNVDSLISMNKGKNGIIHTVSFKLANDIKDRSRYSKNMLVSGDRRDIMEFLSKQDGRIVLSPSIEKGYDLKGDLSRFQIIAKVPYLFLGDALIALNARARPDWYARKCVTRLCQSAGRSVRGVDDWANTYIIDSHMLRLLNDHYDLFPDWFLESIEIIS